MKFFSSKNLKYHIFFGAVRLQPMRYDGSARALAEKCEENEMTITEAPKSALHFFTLNFLFFSREKSSQHRFAVKYTSCTALLVLLKI